LVFWYFTNNRTLSGMTEDELKALFRMIWLNPRSFNKRHIFQLTASDRFIIESTPMTQQSGDTLLHHFVLLHETELVYHLLKVVKVSANVVNASGETPIFEAFQNSVEITGMLMTYGADINARNAVGLTPLCLAVIMGKVNVDVLEAFEGSIDWHLVVPFQEGRKPAGYIARVQKIHEREGAKLSDFMQTHGIAEEASQIQQLQAPEKYKTVPTRLENKRARAAEMEKRRLLKRQLEQARNISDISSEDEHDDDDEYSEFLRNARTRALARARERASAGAEASATAAEGSHDSGSDEDSDDDDDVVIVSIARPSKRTRARSCPGEVVDLTSDGGRMRYAFNVIAPTWRYLPPLYKRPPIHTALLRYDHL
jgi:hypothetical protein